MVQEIERRLLELSNGMQNAGGTAEESQETFQLDPVARAEGVW